MASSDTILFTKSALSDSGSYIQGKLEWKQYIYNSQSTKVKIDLYVKKFNDGTTLTIPTEGTWKYIINFPNVSIQKSAAKSVLTDWVLLYSETRIIEHETDGSCSFNLNGNIYAPTGTSLEGLITTFSKNITLDPIVTSTTLDSLSSATGFLDGEITTTYTPRNSVPYNRRIVSLNVGGTLTTLLSENLGQLSAGQKTSKINLAGKLSTIYDLLPTTTKAIIRVTLQTYSNSGYTKQVGDDQKREIELTIPISVKPTVSLSITQVNTNSWLANKKIYVAGLSGATVTMTGEAGEGAHVKSHNIIYDGSTYDGETPNVFNLKKSGNIAIAAQTIDTRSRSASTSQSITVLSYSAPAVTSMSFERGTYNGGVWTAADDGPDVQVTFKSALSLKDYGNVYNALFKLDGSSITPSGTTTGLISDTENAVYFKNVDGETSHTLTLTVTDSVGKTGTATFTVPTVHITVDYRYTGKGIAFGKTSEHDAFECAWDAEFHGAVKRIRDDGSILTLDDTGWIDLGISDSVTTTSSTSAGHYIGCAYRVVNGNHVYVAFNVRAEYSGSAVTVSKEPIPSEYRPKLQPYAVVTLNGKRVSRILVSRTTGHAMIDWIHNVADDTDGTYTPEPEKHTATWIDGYIDYFI